MSLPLLDDVALVLIGVNIVISLILAITYFRNYRAIAAKVTFGFLIFAGAFLLENILNLFFITSALSQGITGLTTFNLAVNAIELVALLVLAWITWK